jgi:hypothetical protein
MTLLNIGSRKACIYAHHYDASSHSFSAMCSLSKEADDKAAFFIVLKHASGKIVRCVIELKDNRVSLNKRTFQNERMIPKNNEGRRVFRTDSSMFVNEWNEEELFFPVFRPRRPATNVICCSQKSIDAVTKILTDQYRYEPKSNRLILHTPADSKELKKKVEFLRKRGINYVTFYLPDIQAKEFTNSAIVNKIRHNYFGDEFMHVSAMSREGRIFHLY